MTTPKKGHVRMLVNMKDSWRSFSEVYPAKRQTIIYDGKKMYNVLKTRMANMAKTAIHQKVMYFADVFFPFRPPCLIYRPTKLQIAT